jgi:hypothetical protein
MHRSCTGSDTALSWGSIVSPQSRVKVITKPRRTACFSRRNKGPSGSRQRREAEMKRKPIRSRKAKRTVETDPEPKAAAKARSVERRSSGRWGRESRSGCRSSGCRSSRTRVHGGREAGWRFGWSAKRTAAQAACSAVGTSEMLEASSLTGTGERERPDAANRRPLPLAARPGALCSAARTAEVCRKTPDSSIGIGLAPIFRVGDSSGTPAS